MSDKALSVQFAEPVIRVALYARVSSQQQAQAHTVASQVEAIEERAHSDGCRIDKELAFVDEGYSGGTLQRPALEKLRDQIAMGTIDRVYVHSPDRLARSYPHQFVLVEEWQRLGVELVFINHAIGQSPEDQLLLQVQGMMAEYERAKILERSRRGKRHRARQGTVNVLSGAPYGYRYLGKFEGGGEARYEIEPAQAEVVRQMFAWVGLERCSIGAVCRRLKERRIPSPKGRDHWDRTTVWGILRNPAYRGEAHFGKTRMGPVRPRLRGQRHNSNMSRHGKSSYDTPTEDRIVIPVSAIVDPDLFAQVAEQLEENRKRNRAGKRGERFLLQGLLVCAQCGYAYYGKALSNANRKGKPRVYGYYRCVGTDAYRFGGQRVCRNKQCRTDLLEKAVWEDVCALLSDPARMRAEYERRKAEKRASKTGMDPLAKQIANVRRGMSRLLDAYQAGYVEREDFEPRMRQAKDRLTRLEKDRELAENEENLSRELEQVIGHLHEFSKRIQAGLANADWSARRDILRALIKQVEIGEEDVRIVYKVPSLPFEPGPNGGFWQDCWRRDYPALRRSRFRNAVHSVFQDACLQPLVNQSQQHAVPHSPL